MSNFCFSEEEFSEFFPYFICINNNGKVVSFGKTLSNICSIRKDIELTEYFDLKINSEKIAKVLPSMIKANEVMTLRSVDAPRVDLVGKFQYISQNDVYIFLGTPNYVVSDRESNFDSDLIKSSFIDPAINKGQKYEDLRFEDISSAIEYFKQREQGEDGAGNMDEKDVPAITLSNDAGNIIWCNARFERMCGHSFNEVIGKRPRDAMYGKRSVFIAKDFVDVNIQKGHSFYFENIGYTKAGKDFWFGVIVSPIFDRHNNIIARVHSIKDITKKKIQELEIDENEHIMKLAIDAAKAGVWSYDLISEDFKASAYCLKMIGRTDLHKFNTLDLMKMMHPDDVLKFNNKIIPTLRINDPSFVFEHRILVNGVYRFFNARGKCILWSGKGEPVKLVGTLRDITEDKIHLLELEKQKKFYHDILDRLPADVAMWRNDHKYIFVNKNAIKDDRLRSWMIGKDDYDYCKLKGTDNSLADDRRRMFNEVKQAGKQLHYIETKGSGDEVKHIFRVYYPLFDSRNNLELIIGYGVDITDQVKNEQYAKLQEIRMKKIFDIAKDGLFLSDFQGNIATSNSSFGVIMGVNSIGANKLNFLDLLPDSERSVFIGKLNNLRIKGKVQDGIFYLKTHPNDIDKYIEYSIIPSARKEDNSFMARISDVTEVVNKEKNLQDTIAREVQLNNYKSQFIHITSHELRTPLTIIRSNTEIVELLLDNPELLKKKDPRKLTSKIIKEVNVMTEILNELMMVSRIETGNVEINKENIDVSLYIEDLTGNNFRPYADGRNLKVEMAPGITTWNFDPKLLKHALINLITNAFKYSYQRPNPVLSVAANEREIEFKVTDFGIGVPPDEIGSLFTSFFRASNVGVISGTGIGLMVVDYAVKKHNGTVTISSETNKGSVFSIHLPKQ
jgi:PAS domain S-box-containing protein